MDSYQFKLSKLHVCYQVLVAVRTKHVLAVDFVLKVHGVRVLLLISDQVQLLQHGRVVLENSDVT